MKAKRTLERVLFEGWSIWIDPGEPAVSVLILAVWEASALISTGETR